MFLRIASLVLPFLAVACAPSYDYSGDDLSSAAAAADNNNKSIPISSSATAAAVPASADGPFSLSPRDVPGGELHAADIQAGYVRFAKDDVVRKREIGDFPDRYVERLELGNSATFVYERLNGTALPDVSDAALLASDLEQPGFRERGIVFDVAKLGQTGAFTYLAQASATDNCFIFRGRIRHGSDQAGNRANGTAHGNVCYPVQTKDLAAVKAEMLDILGQVRFGPGAEEKEASGATREPPQSGSPAPISLDRCGYAATFSGPASRREMSPDRPSIDATEYDLETEGFKEAASCTCNPDVDYAAVSQFDAVDNTRQRVEKDGFVLKKATFGQGTELGKSLDYEAEAGDGGAFLVGRNFYRHCGFSVEARGKSYADLAKAKKFIASVTASNEEPGTPEVSSSASSAGEAAASQDPMRAHEPSSGGTTPPGSVVPVAQPNPSVIKSAPTNEGAEKADLHGSTKSAAADATAARLRRLEWLLEQKLITPSEYQARRKAIIDAL